MSKRLFYVVGPSGSGKDSIMAYARAQLAGQPMVQFAHRYITRPAQAGGENHIALSPAEFQARVQAGLFAMHWQSHGNRYGIGTEINQWLGKGITVVVNGSREYLPQALLLYPELLPVTIEVAPDILKQRLMRRGRETEADIEARINRNRTMQLSHPEGSRLNNNGTLEEAGNVLVNLIEQHNKVTLCE
ncbi:MAG: phosphonate metabolism protein/1,5-bisphosphokinase (PRPP-forming) PhnN [Gammaproteobacteria bacterium]|uniref:phosphonate metabolism protein/1,5-bisphosphokinase (PRPP-forming) PhnN n=1 Tax=Limnobacter sp. TaxID=2003368 RepID=UPI001DBB064E|nr:phosphonate metabolism protein/1,5-bisphosphokinase (PRPP-forming) PhnN [Limnobacter sp.]MBU0785088.1 phosphonate metabolism protein/1,5-bisphosphokinase (PRPP-forming) PhnN [Gammaproteobacteria bacterium]MBU0849126.1 phosphonate metabolism protein/1,5-bisphosphokinase (PRPP-forming) PhnN [Gammaproteobacteria bacterium]MBU1267877.1 phosphonate metabolism protein/1,5-bisphosphokinase (PRPP-forming) PhnN [Gammaproteobacteria bacterium]MBU1528368.1 phosphonate metabolism protein/1,5-bisphosphok